MCWQTTVTTRCKSCNDFLGQTEFVDRCPSAEGAKCIRGPFKQLVQDPKGECNEYQVIRECQESQKKKNAKLEERRVKLLEVLDDEK
ncbi:hypothetical protein NW768_010365 [Fusarium equiseti]|uniref:Uncharacterized protein n=1 Tax=Fusarium equiseti TaxID=61235 RepID=A0ABQ8R169_FUSEQ|nr:hypothetical protein NW768_010365 [Fusarium equiseti]